MGYVKADFCLFSMWKVRKNSVAALLGQMFTFQISFILSYGGQKLQVALI